MISKDFVQIILVLKNGFENCKNFELGFIFWIDLIAKIGDNAYKVDLPTKYNIASTFNIGDLQLYQEDQELRSFFPQEGGVEPCVHSSAYGSYHEDNPGQEQVHSSAFGAHSQNNQHTDQERPIHVHGQVQS